MMKCLQQHIHRLDIVN